MAATGATRLSMSEVCRFDWDLSDPSSSLYTQEFLDPPPSVSSPPVVHRRVGVLISL
jgi:hypothetical protein